MHIPISNRPNVDQKGNDVQIASDGDVAGLAVGGKLVVDEIFSELLVERTAVRHKGAGNGTISDETLLLLAKVGSILGPTDAFSGETIDESRGLIHLLLQGHGPVLNALLLGHLRVKQALEFG